MRQIPTRRELLYKIIRKLLSPKSIAQFAEFKVVSGDEYLYLDFADFFPLFAGILSKTGGRLEVDSPIFVAGLRRSGTTLFYRLMNANSGLFLFNERFPGDRMNGRGISSERNIFYTVDNPAKFRDVVIRYLSPKLKRKYMRWGAKLALELAHPDPGSVSIPGMERIMAAFPRAKVLGITRDPRDFVLSSLKRGGRDVQWWVDEYLQMMKLFEMLRRDIPDCFMAVKYEDLIDDSKSVLKRCCEFSDIPFEESMLDPSQWSVKGPKEYESMQIAAHHGKWRSATASDRDVVDAVTSACFPMAAAFGYQSE